MSKYVTIEAKLDTALFNRWWNAGYTGSYAAVNQQTSTITYDPSTPMRLENVSLAGGEKFSVILSFKLRPNIVVTGFASQRIHFCQLIGGQPVAGNVSFRINVYPDEEKQQNRPSALFAEENQLTEYQLFPNPANNIIFLRFTGQKEHQTTILVSDLYGRSLMQRKITLIPGVNHPLDLSGFAPGIYFINIINSPLKQTFKIAVLR